LPVISLASGPASFLQFPPGPEVIKALIKSKKDAGPPCPGTPRLFFSHLKQAFAGAHFSFFPCAKDSMPEYSNSVIANCDNAGLSIILITL